MAVEHKNKATKTLAFLSGSSFPGLAIPFLVLGTAMLIRPDQEVLPHTLLWGLPPIMGLWNIGLLYFSKTMSQKSHFIAGAIIGLCFTLLGVATGAPSELYNLQGNQAYIMIPIGVVTHSFIWGVIVYWTNGQLGVRD